MLNLETIKKDGAVRDDEMQFGFISKSALFSLGLALHLKARMLNLCIPAS